MCFIAALERTEVADPVNQRTEHLPERCELLVLKSESSNLSFQFWSFYLTNVFSAPVCFIQFQQLEFISFTEAGDSHEISLTRSFPYTVLQILDFISTQHCLTTATSANSHNNTEVLWKTGFNMLIQQECAVTV